MFKWMNVQRLLFIIMPRRVQHSSSFFVLSPNNFRIQILLFVWVTGAAHWHVRRRLVFRFGNSATILWFLINWLKQVKIRNVHFKSKKWKNSIVNAQKWIKWTMNCMLSNLWMMISSASHAVKQMVLCPPERLPIFRQLLWKLHCRARLTGMCYIECSQIRRDWSGLRCE